MFSLKGPLLVKKMRVQKNLSMIELDLYFELLKKIFNCNRIRIFKEACFKEKAQTLRQIVVVHEQPS